MSLEKVMNFGETIVIKGKQYEIKTASMKRFNRSIKKLMPLIKGIVSLQNGEYKKKNMVDVFTEVYFEIEENMYSALHDLTLIDQNIIDELEIDEFLSLVETVYKINEQYFKKKVIPMAMKIYSSATTVVEKNG